MAIDPRFDFMSFLARKRETLTDWLTRTGVSSYSEFCVQLEKLGAKPVDVRVYDMHAPIVVPPLASPLETQAEILGATEEPADASLPKVKRGRRRAVENSVDLVTDSDGESSQSD